MHFFTAIMAATTPGKQSLCGLAGDIGLGGACSAVQNVTGLPGMIDSITTEFLKFFTNFPGFIKDFIFWIINNFFPNELQTWFFGTVGLQTVPGGSGGFLGLTANNPNDPYHNLYAAMVAPGL